MDLNLAVRTVALAFPLPRALDLRVFVDCTVAVAVLLNSARELLAFAADEVAVAVVLQVQTSVLVLWTFLGVACVGFFAPTLPPLLLHSLRPWKLSPKL